MPIDRTLATNATVILHRHKKNSLFVAFQILNPNKKYFIYVHCCQILATDISVSQVSKQLCYYFNLFTCIQADGFQNDHLLSTYS